MPASFAASAPTGNTLLEAIDSGGQWSGTITYNRLEPWNGDEVARFAQQLPAEYATQGIGLSGPIWNTIEQALATFQRYAAIDYAITEALDANYLASDFYKPSNLNTAGIAGEPGKGPIIGFNPQSWGGYSSQIQQWIVLHELGHTLGLHHVGELPAELNYAPRTVMSYNWHQLAEANGSAGLPLTPMALDVALLQAKYGAAQSNVGATTYELSAFGLDLNGADGRMMNGRGYVCIWDSAGVDTLAWSGGTDALLNLNAATLQVGQLEGDLAAIIAEVAATSRVFAGLGFAAQDELLNPAQSAGGFFSSLYVGGARQAHGYTIAKGAVIENAMGGAGADLIIGNASANGLQGGGGNDDIYGGAGDDSLAGGFGRDHVYGGAGADTLVELGADANYLRGGEGDDSITGGAGFDDIHGNQGSDTCVSGGGDDWVVGGQGNDSLTGSAGHNVVYGNIGADTLDAGAGNDVVRGGQGDDWVYGGLGDDFVAGDRGDDSLIGGVGADIFHSFGEAGMDTVLEFWAPEGDRVMLAVGTVWTVDQAGADTIVSMSGGGRLVLLHTTLSALPDGWIFTG